MDLEKNLVRQLAVRIALDGNRKSTLDIITSRLEGNEYSNIIEPALKDIY